ncbi:MAG: hypothetical protein II250_02765, partial [Agathobacter sp.]|nr:hypothetical protein [Agathobacter sp.]
MSKTVRKQLLGTIKTLKKALDEVARSIFSAQENIVLLKDCQHLVEVVKHRIETLCGKNLSVIAELEKCKELFCVAEQEQEQEHDVSSICRNILQQIDEVEKAFEQDFPDKLEVVFLPYKASMWDSLESVWMAARDDENCEAYVVPIPYYDKNPDETLGEMHYEGELYPDYVPVTGFWEYDLELHHPDVVYIHNGYDQYNVITSVDPRFFTKKLKRNTECLVYIPYFVLNEINPDDKAMVKSVENFCNISGIVSADKVIVQSEKMREVYISNLLNFYGVTPENHKMLEEKVLGLGSPKLDKVRTTTRETVDVPSEWNKLMYKPNGERKKVVFYNNGLGALLQYNEKVLEKIQSVIALFYEKKDEVTLLWRPHPHLRRTIECMRPELGKKYCKIVEDYKNLGWGIYDDTADINRAIAISDVYYGDHSSVIELFKEAGKQVMIQSPNLFKENERYTLSSECVCDTGKYLWSFHVDFNALFKIDKKDCIPQFVGSIPNEPILQERLYTDILECNGKIYMCPFYAEEIAEYDLSKKTFRKIPFRNAGDYKIKCFKAIAIGTSVYFIPYFYPFVICYETEEEKISYIDICVDNVENTNLCMQTGYFMCYEVYEEKLILPFAFTDSVVVINTKTNKSFIVEKIGNSQGFVGICAVEDNFYLGTSDGKIVKSKLFLENSSSQYLEFPDNNEISNGLYPITRIEDNIYIFPHAGGEAFKLDTKADKIEKME